ncbi:MAG: sigma-70 family RNA polymerase sigma factor [Candidatus Dadabacteria bacterium]|nr:sigma-70 family RNA polymerase sigma factor [Candidatus Dadabacteria bacterium]
MASQNNKSEVNQLVDNLFRDQSGKMVSRFARFFSQKHLQIAEDIVQDAFIKAQELWLDKGIPENPPGWLWQVAKNKAIDLLRREKTLRQKGLMLVQDSNGEFNISNFHIGDEVKDDQLRMIFTCCHPLISRESQVALTLKILCGFSVTEIAKAFLKNEPTIAKRLVRARQKIRELKIPYEVPMGGELLKRFESVLQVLYLLFNEGYNASTGDNLVRPDLCNEAIRLTTLLVEHPLTDKPQAHALLALMLLNASRLPARLDK